MRKAALHVRLRYLAVCPAVLPCLKIADDPAYRAYSKTNSRYVCMHFGGQHLGEKGRKMPLREVSTLLVDQ